MTSGRPATLQTSTPPETTLRVAVGDISVLESRESWLYPLFSLEAFVARAGIDPASLSVHDKVVGRAGALILAHLGVRRVRTDIASRLALDLTATTGLAVDALIEVDRIDCRTETILEQEEDPSKGYEVVRGRCDPTRLAAVVAEGAAAADRYLSAPDAPSEPVLTTTDLVVGRGGAAFLAGVSLEIGRGECVAISGPNGCGKTTLLLTLLGVLPPLGGEIARSATAARPGGIAYLPQQAMRGATPFSVAEVASFGLKRARRTSTVPRLLGAVGVAGLARRRLRSLSGGEYRRVEIARCLGQDAALMILDEPFAGIDRGGRLELARLLSDHARRTRCAVVCTTHHAIDELPADWTRMEVAT